MAFKEGFCYRKWEAAGLFLTLPLLLLGHLSSTIPSDVEVGLVGLLDILMLVGMYIQPNITMSDNYCTSIGLHAIAFLTDEVLH